ncbi:CASH domain-containing protein [Candidatus Methanophagaceae archaeon]|nr:CASH domain-containing protein [Methanophagales archaeon]
MQRLKGKKLEGEKKIVNTERRILIMQAVISAVILIALSICVGCASAATYTVCPSGCNYTSIQAAIDAAEPGNTIEVYSGTYYEIVNVTKRLILNGVDTGTGKPVVDAGGSGSVIAFNANGITLEGFTVTNSGHRSGCRYRDAGIMVTSNNNAITGNNVNNNEDGIYLDSSSHNTITGNIVRNNDGYGIRIFSSYHNNIRGNTACNNIEDGICIFGSDYNNIAGNTVSNNNGYGIVLSGGCSNTNTTGNTFVNDSFFDCLGPGLGPGPNIVKNNIVNGKPLVYLKDTSDIVVTDAGQVILVNCTNITVKKINSSNVDVGIYLAMTERSIISHNNISNCGYGILIGESYNNSVTGNNLISNGVGISVWFADSSFATQQRNKIYLNNFINNTCGGPSYWNSTEEISYTYNGHMYTNYLGNYWSNYKDDYPNAEEIDRCGIWDMPYRRHLEGDKDKYPLMRPWENYFATAPSVFDTYIGTYPSLMGTHTGTITPSQNITASKLYTYPCTGTGGHTESINLYENGTLIANGTWTGYLDEDWHNITLHNGTDSAHYVTLLQDQEYNYTIRTGSYPQILHATSKEVSGGTITCTSFVDANGKTYTDRIPAIKFF